MSDVFDGAAEAYLDDLAWDTAPNPGSIARLAAHFRAAVQAEQKQE